MNASVTRRDFLKGASALTAAGMIGVPALSAAATPIALKKLPRWRGFNLLEKFIARVANKPFREEDFTWMAKWGFDFVRLPMSYHCWSDPHNWHELREPVLREIDAAIGFGRKHGVHVSLNFHRAPGYSVEDSTPEPFNLWTDAEALDACVFHWRHFARRYRDIPSSALSFNLINEPAYKVPGKPELLDDAGYARVVRALVQAIREDSPDRLIIADGLLWGRVPVPALADLGIAQSLHIYDPMLVTHWKAGWVQGADQWPEPTWPLPVSPEAAAGERKALQSYREAFRDNPIVQRTLAHFDPAAAWNRDRLDRQIFQPWRELAAMGVPVHLGEFGVFNRTPHPVALAWMRDVLSLAREAGWGWALWNFRNDFGVLDTDRTDVAYEDFHGHKLDRAMLELLQAS